MREAVTIAALCLALSTAVDARPVAVSGSGTLAMGTGRYQPGDPFTFSTAYDDSAPRVSAPGGPVAYSGVGTTPIVFTVAGDRRVASVLYDLIVGPGTFFIGTPSDYAPTVAIEFMLTRADPADRSLPTAPELAGATGRFVFFNPGVDGNGGTGSGAFVASPAALPEPGTVLLFVAGLVGCIARRAHRSSAPSA